MFYDTSKETRLRTERLPDGTRKLLTELTRKACGVDIVVPEGFPTDFSSIPAPARFIVRWSKVDIAGVVHDWCYHVGLQDESGKPSKELADRIWWVIAQRGESRANRLQAWLCWAGLRIDARRAWKEHRAKDDEPSEYRQAYLASLKKNASPTEEAPIRVA